MKLGILTALLFAGVLHADSLPFTPQSVPGGIVALPLPETAQAPIVHYHGERVMVRRFDQRWYAIVGIPLSANPGDDRIELDDAAPIHFSIAEKAYPEQHITLKNPRQVNPNPEDMQRIAREQKLMAPVWNHFDPERAPTLHVVQPASGELTSSFGLRRFFNGEARAPHSGLDIAAPMGAAIHAPEDGVVMLTGNFFFNGNSVFIDHGQGMVSLFCHLSRIDVKLGDQVKSGDRIGLVGKTGRATGPHLHWSLSLNNARVDPRILLRPAQAQTQAVTKLSH